MNSLNLFQIFKSELNISDICLNNSQLSELSNNLKLKINSKNKGYKF